METLKDSLLGKTQIYQYRLKIDNCKKQLTQLYAEIGEAYYFYHKDDVNAEERERIVRASGINKQIEDLEDKILLVRGFVRCPNCHKEIQAGTTFCSECGYRVIPPERTASQTTAPDIHEETVLQVKSSFSPDEPDEVVPPTIASADEPEGTVLEETTSSNEPTIPADHPEQ